MQSTYIDFSTRSILNLSELEEKLYEVNRISVLAPHRGKGIGRKLMEEMLQNADREQVSLVLDINPYGDMNFKQLEAWYGRLGFKFSN